MVIRSSLAATRLLRDRGVKYAFGVPGESFLGLLDALYETPEIELVTCRHEGGAAFMADAAAKLIGQPSICMGTRGVGTANLAIGIHTAYQDSTPMLAMVGQVETPFRHREALQEVELAPFLGEITKWSVEPPSASELPRLVSEAYRMSMSGRPGPVGIVLRGDILDEEVPEPDLPSTAPIETAVAADVAGQVIDLLKNAKQPVIIAGGGVLRAGAVAPLVAFAEQTGIPVATAFRRLDAFPTDHPLSLGSLSFGTPAVVRERMATADVILAIGARLNETTTLGYTVPTPGTTLIHVDIDPETVGKTYPAAIGIAADARVAIATLANAAQTVSWPDRSAEQQELKAKLTAVLDASSVSTAHGVDPAVVMRELSRQLPDRSVLTSDAGNFWTWTQRYGSFTHPGTFLGPVSGAMGYAVPSAVAAAIVNDSAFPSVSLSGDGGFLMTANELATAAQRKLNVICVVFDNGIYGTIRAHQEREFPGRVSGTDIWTPDLVKYAEAFGGQGFRVERNDQAADAIAAAIANPGISVIDVVVDPENISAGTAMSSISKR
ncbi:MAG: thiamine pyrophosphate-binding protein [Thermomicrobiales bacterium]|nr:thiamine pyrophosphate-binding protein [Thermomicrobiales bacterium]